MKIITMAMMIFVIIFLGGCSSEKENKKSIKPVIVKTVEVKKELISIPIHTSGILSPAKEIKLSFKTSGIIRNIWVDEGKTVKKDELLAQLDLSEINSQVLQATEGYEKSKRDFERVKNLYSDSVVTLEQLQNVETAMQIAEANFNIAKFNQKHSRINAPSNGKILKKFAEENEMVAVGTPIFLFGSSESDWIVKVGVTDRDIIKIQNGDSAWVFIDVFPSRRFKAVVTSVGSAANPMNGTYEVELSLNEKEPKFTSGFIAKTDIFPSAQTPFYIIPLEAIAQADEFSVEVYTVDENSEAKKINVNIYRIFDEKAAVSRGLEDVQFIVTEGVNYLSEGAKVTIKE